MLYVSTRQRQETYTALRTLLDDCAPDGGGFLPMQLPALSEQDVERLLDQPFCGCVADTLNLFFSAKVTAEEVREALNWQPEQLPAAGQRIVCGELWDRSLKCILPMVEDLTALVLHRQDIGLPTHWGRVAMRIALLAGLLAVIRRSGETGTVDVAVVSGDFSTPMAAWFARQMGLPVGTIICGCNENSAPWDLLHRGELKTSGVAVKTQTPMVDISLPIGLEYLVSACLGDQQTGHYLDICRRGGIYTPRPDELLRLQDGMFAAVVSDSRMLECIPNVYNTFGYLLSPYTALAYAGLMDLRAIRGELRPALLLAEESPLYCAETVARAMGMSVDQLRRQFGDR